LKEQSALGESKISVGIEKAARGSGVFEKNQRVWCMKVPQRDPGA